MRSTRWTKVIFIAYIILLTWVILFKMDLTETIYRMQYSGYRSLNLIPFAGTAVYNGQLAYREIGLNIGVFIPYGIYLRVLHTKESRFHDFLQITLCSLLFEVIQFCFSIGVADVTDLLANSLGGLVGIVLFDYLKKIGKTKVVGWINLWSLVGILFLLLYLQIRR